MEKSGLGRKWIDIFIYIRADNKEVNQLWLLSRSSYSENSYKLGLC